jgi:hypothetical protein
MSGGEFHAIRIGHVKNAKKLLLEAGTVTMEKLAMMSDSEVENVISKHYIAVIYQSEAGLEGYDDITLIPKAEWGKFPVIHR